MSSQDPVVHSDDKNDPSPEQQSTLSTASARPTVMNATHPANDALRTTLTALSTEPVDLALLTQECEAILRKQHVSFDEYLKVTCVLPDYEIRSKRPSITINKHSNMVELSIAQVARRRGVSLQQVASEIRECQRLNLALHQKVVPEQEAGSEHGRDKQPASKQESQGDGLTGGVDDGKEDGKVGQAEMVGEIAKVGEQADHARGEGDSRSAPDTKTAPIRPLDPRPIGQPYAGTKYYVPGFRLPAGESWEDWLRDWEAAHPHLRRRR